jgi:hypothetical protein
MKVRLHKSDDDLQQILHLQKRNHKDFITPKQAEKEGYVTVRHSLESLKAICGNDGHVIAMDGGHVIGYALTMHSYYAEHIPVLQEMMDQIRTLIGDIEFLIVGQLCVDINWRGKGVVAVMYDHMKNMFGDAYPGIYTEIALDNPRSMRSHIKCGFQVMKSYHNQNGKQWNIVYCNWT